MPATRSIQPIRLPNFASWINWGLGVVFLMSCVFSVVSFAVLAPNIEQEAGLSSSSLSILTSVFFFAYSIAQLIAGILIDRHGVRWILGLTALLASVGGFLFIASDNVVMMYFARGLMGVGLSSAFVAGLYLASKWFPANRFGVMSGITNMAANLAGALGSWAIAGLSYSPVVLWWAVINTVVAAAILLLVKNQIPQTDDATSDSPQQHDLAKMFGFLLRSRQTWLASLFFTGTFGTFLSYANFWNIQVQQGYGISIDDAASLNALLPIGLAFGSVLFGLFADRIGRVAMPCRLCAVSSLLAFAILVYTPSVPMWAVAALLFISGFCFGGATLAFPAAVQHCRPHMQGAAIGLVTTCGYIGAGILNIIVPLITGPITKSPEASFSYLHPISLTPEQLANVKLFQQGMIPLVIATAVAVLASILIRDNPREPLNP